jgi:hypothetical protein
MTSWKGCRPEYKSRYSLFGILLGRECWSSVPQGADRLNYDGVGQIGMVITNEGYNDLALSLLTWISCLGCGPTQRVFNGCNYFDI